MFTLRARRENGSIFSLTQNEYLMITDVQGLEPPRAEFSLAAGQYQDGSKVSMARVGTRNIVIYGSILHDSEMVRQRLYHYFAVKGSVTLLYTSPLREVQITGRVESISVNAFARPVSFQISILCPQPYWEALSEDDADIANVVGGLEFPVELLSDGIELGTIKSTQDVALYNGGELSAGLDIYLEASGAVDLPMIYNSKTNERFRYKGSLEEGDVLHICTKQGQRSVTHHHSDGTEENAFNYIDMGSTWLQAAAGDNFFSVYADSGLESLHVRVSFRRLYQGV